jgi:hypothetical protein
MFALDSSAFHLKGRARALSFNSWRVPVIRVAHFANAVKTVKPGSKNCYRCGMQNFYWEQ